MAIKTYNPGRRFLNSLTNDPRLELVARIKRDWPNGVIEKLTNVFGEVGGKDGYVEKTIRPETGGTFKKIYGCSYLYKHSAWEQQIHGIEFSKGLFSDNLRVFVKNDWIFAFDLAYKFLFRRKKFLFLANYLFENIDKKVTKWYDIPARDYNLVAKEIKRAVGVALQNENNNWGKLLEKASRYICLFLEFDNSYRWRIQDAFGEVNNRAAERDGAKEFFRLFELMISRETGNGVGPKWRFLRPILHFVLFTSPTLRRILGKILANLHAPSVQMDEADWYFCLGWMSYNFRGKDFEWRTKERERIDAEKGHIYLL